MGIIKKIRIVSTVYPLPRHPERGRFTANLAEDWSLSGVASDVLTTTTLAGRLRMVKRKPENVDIPNVTVRVIDTFGTPGGRFLPRWFKRVLNERRATRLALAQENMPSADLIYAQFAVAGRFARDASLASGVPYFLDLGESNSLTSGTAVERAERSSVVRDATGVVCVSPRLRDEAIALGCAPQNVKLIPNFPNWDRFRPLDKKGCRQRLGLDAEAFLVVYVGRFSERKGAPRLNQALKQMKHPAIAAFLGSGDLVPDFDGVVHAESVTHNLLPIWLNAADVLALPTLAEGCCNAIAEALACGLPIVSSDIEDIRWQVPAENTILVDPADPSAIASALDAFAADPRKLADMRETLSALTLATRGQNRADEILTWMAGKLEQDSKQSGKVRP